MLLGRKTEKAQDNGAPSRSLLQVDGVPQYTYTRMLGQAAAAVQVTSHYGVCSVPSRLREEAYCLHCCLGSGPCLLKIIQAQIPRGKQDRTGALNFLWCLCPTATILYSSPLSLTLSCSQMLITQARYSLTRSSKQFSD